STWNDTTALPPCCAVATAPNAAATSAAARRAARPDSLRGDEGRSCSLFISILPSFRAANALRCSPGERRGRRLLVADAWVEGRVREGGDQGADDHGKRRDDDESDDDREAG